MQTGAQAVKTAHGTGAWDICPRKPYYNSFL